MTPNASSLTVDNQSTVEHLIKCLFTSVKILKSLAFVIASRYSSKFVKVPLSCIKLYCLILIIILYMFFCWLLNSFIIKIITMEPEIEFIFHFIIYLFLSILQTSSELKQIIMFFIKMYRIKTNNKITLKVTKIKNKKKKYGAFIYNFND